MSDTYKGFKIPNIQLEQPLEKSVLNYTIAQIDFSVLVSFWIHILKYFYDNWWLTTTPNGVSLSVITNDIN